MSWVDENRGAGPWPFTEQGDKWAYLNNPRWTDTPEAPVNYTGREDEEPQVWIPGDQNNHIVVDNEFSKDHKPCGHWHKRPIPVLPPPPGNTPEIYWELLNSQSSQVYLVYHDDLMGLESFVKINIDEFDGDITWAFEVIGFNDYAFDVKVQIVDDLGNICAETIFAAGTVGASGYELFRQRVDFTPTFGDRSYGLRIEKSSGDNILSYPLKFFLTTARIVIHQENATKTKIQISLWGDTYNYALTDYATHLGDLGDPDDLYPYSYPVGQVLGNSDVSDFTDDWGGGDSNYFTTIWKYDSSELDTVSKVVFTVVAKSQTPSSSYKSFVQYLASSLPIEAFYLILYRSPYGSPIGACNPSTPVWGPEDQVYTDGCTGTVFTPIPNSLLSWNGVPYPYVFEIHPDFSGLTGHFNFCTGGDVALYGEGPWSHYCRWFSLDIPVGTAIVDATIRCESTSPKDQTWTFTYRRTRIADPLDLTVALWNMTDDCLVPNSELVWEKEENFSRKHTEIALSDFKSGCEYEFVVKCPDFVYSATKIGRAPEIVDAQLWLNVDPISQLTVWQRLFRVYESYHDSYYIPDSWGPDYWGDSLGSISVGCRIKLLSSEGIAIYYEQTVYVENDHGDIADLYYTVLEELGIDGNDGTIGVDVSGGKLTWYPSIYHLKRARQRTGPLSLTSGKCYSVRHPDVCGYTFFPNNGFIVISVNFRDIK